MLSRLAFHMSVEPLTQNDTYRLQAALLLQGNNFGDFYYYDGPRPRPQPPRFTTHRLCGSGDWTKHGPHFRRLNK